MARGFRRVGESYEAVLAEHEREVVLTLVQQTLDIVAVDEPVETADPFEALMNSAGMGDFFDDGCGDDSDPALDRLVPDAHRDDPLASVEFRRLTSRGIRERKAEKLLTAQRAFSVVDDDVVALSRQVAEEVLVALTDVRLVIGDRLGLRTDRDAEELERRMDSVADEPATEEDATFVTLMLFYDFLTWLQETLASSMLEDPELGRGCNDAGHGC